MEDNRKNDHKEDKVSTLMQTVGKLAITATALSPFIALTNVEAAPTITSTPTSGNYYFPTMSESINISPYFTLPTSHGATYEVYYQDTGSWHMLPTSGSLHYFDDSTVPYGTKHLWGKATDQVDSVSASVYWDVELTTFKPTPDSDSFEFGTETPTLDISDFFNMFTPDSLVLKTVESNDLDVVVPVIDANGSSHQKVILHGLQTGDTQVKVSAENPVTHEIRDSSIDLHVVSPFAFTQNVFPLTVAKGTNIAIQDPDPLSSNPTTMYLVSVQDLAFGILDSDVVSHNKLMIPSVGDTRFTLHTADLPTGFYVCMFYENGIHDPLSLQMIEIVDPVPGLTESTSSIDIQTVVTNLSNPNHSALSKQQIKNSLKLISPQNVPKWLIPSYYDSGLR